MKNVRFFFVFCIFFEIELLIFDMHAWNSFGMSKLFKVELYEFSLARLRSFSFFVRLTITFLVKTEAVMLHSCAICLLLGIIYERLYSLNRC